MHPFKRNLPTYLTLARFVCVVPLCACILVPQAWAATVAFYMFIALAFTDWLDGALARRWQCTSTFGAFMDALADKVLVQGAFAALVLSMASMPWGSSTAVPYLFIGWLLMLIREFWVSGLRMLASNQGHVVPADALGKWKTATQMASLTAFLWLLMQDNLVNPAEQSAELGLVILVVSVAYITYVAAVALCVLSGINYTVQLKDVLSTQR